MSKTLECLPFYYKVQDNVKRRKPKEASLETNNNKKPTDITFYCTAFGKFKSIAESILNDSGISKVGL